MTKCRFDHTHCHSCGCLLTKENKYSGTNILCKSCKNKKDREYKIRRRNDQNDSYKEDEKSRAMEYYRSNYQAKRDEFLGKYKTPCAKCGESRNTCLVFHHVDPKTKKFSIGAAYSFKKYTEKEFIDEIGKCICLCDNCHREFHHLFYHKINNPIQNLENYLGKKITYRSNL